MNKTKPTILRTCYGCGLLNERGIAVLELAIILPVLLLITFAIIDFGRLFQARLILTNLAREGGSIASRERDLATGTYTAADLITMLQNGAFPLNLESSGHIYIWKIKAAEREKDDPKTAIDESKPYIDNDNSDDSGSLAVQSSIGSNKTYLGLTDEIYSHLEFDTANQTADISEVTVVEVFYRFTPVTPIISISQTFFNTPLLNNMVISSKAVF
ncbi:MAG: TadE-like protein [Syntrophus sp. PtaB.Bin001]|nr:MAG: TadE-like protein [Syntrophus sp. PtaB.Bin001]